MRKIYEPHKLSTGFCRREQARGDNAGIEIPINTNPLYLLIAEDEAAHVEAIRRAFDKADGAVEIRAVGTLREYQAGVAERMPDLALVDLNLPDGRAVEILTHPPEAARFPVLVMTAFGNQQIVVEVMKAGALDYVVKSPETFATMPRTVERALREWNLLQQHKQAAEQIRDAKEAWERTFDAVPDLVAIIDEKHTILRANRAMAEKMGVTTEQAAGLTCYQCVHGTQRPPDSCPHAKLLQDGQAHATEIHEDRWGGDFFVSCTPLYDTDGKLIGSVHVARDITARKLMENQLLDSNQQLEKTLSELRQTQRQIVQHENLRVLGQMASGIAHDFNNSLAPIMGFSELLLKHPEKLADHEQVLKRLQIINTCASDAARIVRQMREFGNQHVGNGEFQPIDLNKLVRQTIERTQPRWKDQVQAAGQTIEITTDLLPVPLVYGEEYAIREMLTNLIFNAVEALPTGGTITLSTLVDGQSVALLINDNGAGLSVEVRQRIFEPFFTTKSPHGTGLGLALVHDIVQRHNGTVEVESNSGQGTTFKIRFPIESIKPTEPSLPATAAALTRSVHVLVVDDEPLLCAIAEALLAGDGHTVETVANGTMALARLKTGKFDVVITDKAMPVMNGEHLAAAICQIVPELPIIMMTGFGDMMKVAGEMPPHIKAILCKPITQATLRTVLAKALPALKR